MNISHIYKKCLSNRSYSATRSSTKKACPLCTTTQTFYHKRKQLLFSFYNMYRCTRLLHFSRVITWQKGRYSKASANSPDDNITTRPFLNMDIRANKAFMCLHRNHVNALRSLTLSWTRYIWWQSNDSHYMIHMWYQAILK